MVSIILSKYMQSTWTNSDYQASYHIISYRFTQESRYDEFVLGSNEYVQRACDCIQSLSGLVVIYLRRLVYGLYLHSC